MSISTTSAALRPLAFSEVVRTDIVGCFCGYGEVEVVGAGFKKGILEFSQSTLSPALSPCGVNWVSSLIPHYILGIMRRMLLWSPLSQSRPISGEVLGLTPKSRDYQRAQFCQVTPEEAMFINQMTVESLVGATCAGELQVEVVTLKATITAINNRFGWYYISCKSCVKRGTLRDGVYICNNCKKPIELPLAMFCINLQVEDHTGTTTVVLLNSTAERLLDVSAKKLINKMPEGDTSIPLELQALVSKEFMYKMKLNKYNLIEGLQDYGVSTVFTPIEDLEVAYEKKDQAQASSNLEGSSTSSTPIGGSERKRKLSTVIEASQASEEGNNGSP
ncbi:uncharacterized protein LOC141691720 [Apium graveolens]|uniref:uncharacterized protein LOC141691720 n=1 Tax=Apium graveolens TaxID=4045 RepID=UPI003D79BA58